MRRALSGLLLLAAVTGAHAQAWPSKPIRWIVPIAAGGSTDVATRLIAGPLSAALGQPIVVENRPGASMIIGIEAAMKAPADGYTLLSVDNAYVLNTALFRKLPYDPERDLDPVALYGRIPMLVTVRSSLPVQDMAGLIALAKQEQGRLTFGSAGKGSPHHLLQELLKHRTGTDFVHVPFKGGTPAVLEQVAGRLDVTVTNLGTAIPHADAGRIRILATSVPQRNPRRPQVPTMQESGGPEMDVAAWQGVLVPKGTPRPVVERLGAEILAILNTSKVADAMADAGTEPTPADAGQFADLIRRERALWEPLIRSWGISLD